MNPPRHRLMKPRYCPEVGFTRPHWTQPEVLRQILAFWKKSRSRPQPVNTTPLGSTLGSTITQHFITATSHKYHFPSSRVFHIASI
ncbi:hypothetical protein E2C01_001811 [Portunus trituberculatus]|uniref:Uncharacterized protein n=1 Tax=Portunus trituberculatus TaxID=210409 RepID=A0A5B7CJ64_PORTR|nr:hypothetical protein [Portunus trituberculatus]